MARVFVGLSGGVDSAVSAALLKEHGHQVVGCFIKIWQPEFIECTWREDRLDAMRICASLQIPFKEIDLSEEYKNEVIKDMIEGYRRGITPNPDVLCNRKIKFGSFAKWAFSNGADMIATGHYARIEKYGHGVSIFRGIDRSKDQSYFLWQLTPEDLARTIFPVGGMTKIEVRSEARRRKLPVAQKRDSQGLCFVGDISLPEFLSHYISFQEGKVLDMRGQIVGKHSGAALYTIGQRHGFTHVKNTPLYIVRINVDENTITVSETLSDAKVGQVRVRDVNWIENPRFPFESGMQLRYRESPGEAKTYDEAHIRVEFSEKRVAAPGQSLVWYEGERVIGGGVVEKGV